MKKILFFAFVLLSFAASAQYVPMTAYGYKMKRIKPDSVLHLPVLSDTSSLHTVDTTAQFALYQGVLYYHWGHWRPVGTGTGGGSGIDAVYAGNCLTKINDSTLALDLACVSSLVHDSIVANYFDSLSLSNRINLKQDTTYRTVGKDSIQFTIGGRYHAIKDSIADISGKLNISDTTGHWVYNVYKRADSFFYAKNGIETFVGLDNAGSTDTTSLSNRINLKQDTTYRTPGKDSIQFTIGGRYHAIKDSTGSGNGSILDTTFQWSVLDSLSTPNGGAVSGDIYLVGTAPTGVFIGHANEIATYDGANYTFQTAIIGDLLYNATTDFVSKWTGTAWVRVGRATIHQGGDKYATTIKIGANDNRALSLKTNNTNRISIAAAGGITLNSLTGAGNQIVGIDATGLLSRVNSSAGTVTNFSAGNLSPLFTTSVATSTTTPALTFAQSNTSQFTVLGRIAAGSGAYSFVTADSSLVQGLHSENYYNTKYLTSFAETDPLSVHITDSSAMLLPYVRGGSIAWPGTIYSTPTIATYSGHNLTYTPVLANQSAYTVFGRASGTGVPSFIAGIDSNWVTELHTENYYNTKYLYTASNGLTLASNNFKWGGTLVNNTTITGGGFYSAFNGGRLEAGQGAAIAAANNLTLGADGNTFSITGATQINAITTSNWQAGSVVNLIFTSTPVIKHNTAGGAGTAVILLAGGQDFTAGANDVLTLEYDGTSWHQTALKIAAVSGLYWPRATANLNGTLLGQDTIKSNVANQLHFNGTYTTTANNQYHTEWSPTITSRATASDNIIGLQIAPTITAAAASQRGIILDIAGTFNNGAGGITGVSIRHAQRIVPATNNAVQLGEGTLLYSSVNATTGAFTQISLNTPSQLLFTDGNSLAKIVGNSGGTFSPFFQIGNSTQLGATTNYTIDAKGGMSSYGDNVIRQIATPSAPTLNVVGTAGTTSITYKVVARMPNGTTTDASTGVTTTTANATLTGSNAVNVTVIQVAGAVFYDVYVTATSGAATLGKIGTYTSLAFFNGVISHTSNAQGDGSTAPTTNTTGSIVVGGTTALGALTLRAGVAGAMGAPLVFQSGTDLTTGVDGAVNWDGSNLQIWDGTTKYSLPKTLTGSAALDFGSTGAGAVADLTITVTGAADGDVVMLGVPNGSVTATATYTAWVSAANTVTVRFSPKATENPASGTFKVRIIQ